jgi:hypothetical protein
MNRVTTHALQQMTATAVLTQEEYPHPGHGIVAMTMKGMILRLSNKSTTVVQDQDAHLLMENIDTARINKDHLVGEEIKVTK